MNRYAYELSYRYPIVRILSVQTTEVEITGPLQAKIMRILKDDALCGVEIMGRLNLKSPGTIYPVLKVLRTRGLVDYKVEVLGATRKKVYSLTEAGGREIREGFIRSAKVYCCDASLLLNRTLKTIEGLVAIKRHQKVLCTLENDEVRRFLSSADVTFSYDLNVSPDTYDLALSFLGVGCFIGKETADITDYVGRLYKSLKKGGYLLAIEIEKTDNMFAGMFFEDVVGLKESLGLQKGELEGILERIGFNATQVTSKSGLLYAVSQKT